MKCRVLLHGRSYSFALVCIVFGFGAANTLADQTGASNLSASNSTDVTPFTITQSGPNNRIWQKVIAQSDANGNVTYITNSFMELATGLNSLVGNQWVESSDIIQITASGGQATNCQHQVNFAANINTAGCIDVTMPDGQHLNSSVLGIGYYDSGNGQSVPLAQLHDSIGQLLQSSNQVIYESALTDSQTNFQADVLYTHRKAGFEQDIILRTQPPSPAAVGLNPDTTEIQIWTEFYNAPDPELLAKDVAVAVQNNGQLERLVQSNQNLNFGSMQMGRGNAFLGGGGTNEFTAGLLVPVAKHWVVQNGRKFLVEEVPYDALVAQLSTLPQSASSGGAPTNSLNEQSLFHEPAKTVREAQLKPQGLRLAKRAPKSSPGLVLDYNLINANVTNFTFQSDTTYYISGALNLYGTTTLEGGTVIKFSTNAASGVVASGDIVCLTSPYRPAIFTTTNDNSVGVTLGPGPPTLCMSTYLDIEAGTNKVSNLRMSYGFNGFGTFETSADVWDCQFIACSHPITAAFATTNLGLHNVLMTMSNGINNGQTWVGGSDCGLTFYSTACVVHGEHITADLGARDFALFSLSQVHSLSLTNSIIIASNLVDCPGFAGLTTNHVYYSASFPTNVFQTGEAANYYLATSSPCHGVGTTNLSPNVLVDIQQRTTYPPVFIAQSNFLTDTILSPSPEEVPRDSSSTADLGYHYAPIDFIGGSNWVLGCTLTLTNGVAIGFYNSSGLIFSNANLISQGTPNNENQFVWYRLVQEQATNLNIGYSNDNAIYNSAPYSDGDGVQTLSMRFTTLNLAQGESPFIGSAAFMSFHDCEIFAPAEYLVIFNNSTATNFFENNLFHRLAGMEIFTESTGPFIAYNNLFFKAPSGILMTGSGGAANIEENNALDGCSGTFGGTHDYNAYLNGGSGSLSETHSLTNTTFAWTNGPLGYFYQATNSSLTNSGSTTADLLGLYQYTTHTNEVKQGFAQVDIGYHYVAVNGNDQPIDTNGDTVPDYLEDVNGNGYADNGETDWMVMLSDPNDIGPTALTVYTPLK